jgi:hypothetical protein
MHFGMWYVFLEDLGVFRPFEQVPLADQDAGGDPRLTT